MPGIAGLITTGPSEDAGRTASTMVEVMVHERFYETGAFAAPECGVYCGWARPRGASCHPPVIDGAGGGVTLLLDGECFGAGDQLPQGFLERYVSDGIDAVAGLNGVFSGLLVDRKLGRAWLFNDRYGTNRLYTHESGDVFYFASEAKSILAVAPECRRFDRQGIDDYLTYGCTLGGRSLFQGISVAGGASLVGFAAGRRESRGQYFEPRQWEQSGSLSQEAFEESLAGLLAKIVPRYTSGTENIGVSITAGLDTRMMMASLDPDPDRVTCFTYSGEELDLLDATIGAKVAESRGLQHEVLRIGEDFFDDFEPLARRNVFLTDGAARMCSTHELYMSRLARGIAPVRLTGNYGSEILRGVSTFGRKRYDRRAVIWGSDGGAGDGGVAESGRTGSAVTRAAFTEVGETYFGLLAASRSQIGFRTPYLDNEFVELAYSAPGGVKAAEQVCCGVVRRNDRRLAQIPSDQGFLGDRGRFLSSMNRVMGRVCFKLDYWASSGLPANLTRFDPAYLRALRRLGILGTHKHLHYNRWIKSRIGESVAELALRAADRLPELFDRKGVEAVLEEHAAGLRSHVQTLDLIATLGIVNDELLDSQRWTAGGQSTDVRDRRGCGEVPAGERREQRTVGTG